MIELKIFFGNGFFLILPSLNLKHATDKENIYSRQQPCYVRNHFFIIF